MHPAPSVIIFTTLTGLGFGLLIMLGFNKPNVEGWVLLTFLALGLGLSVIGLLASTFHLKNPKNAIKAFNEWRSSWLSREGWCAVATLLVMGLYGFIVLVSGVKVSVLGWIGSILAFLTVLTTSMIYAQLKTVPRWNHWITNAHLISLCIAGGSLLAGKSSAAPWFLLIATIIQIAHWYIGDGQLAKRGHTAESATGLGGIGRVKAFEPPHTGTNYLLKEMVYVVARKHSQKLRVIALAFGYLIPLTLLFTTPMGHTEAGFVVLSHLFGIIVSRWLFFAEAEHVVGIYYGKR